VTAAMMIIKRIQRNLTQNIVQASVLIVMIGKAVEVRRVNFEPEELKM
jgi:hypothetical protein